MGTTPMDKSSLNVLTAFRYRVRCHVVSAVAIVIVTTLQTYVRYISTRKEDLGDGLLHLPEQIVPKCNEAALPDSRQSLSTRLSLTFEGIDTDLTSLFPRETLRPTSDVHAFQADTNGA
jgi:hypothetical protein